MSSQWNTGFGVAITITNLGSPLTSWTLGYSYAGNQQLAQGWNGTWSQTGQNVTVTNASWNGSLATGGSVQIGANFSYSGTNTSPTAFTLNGVACTGQTTGGGGTHHREPDLAVGGPGCYRDGRGVAVRGAVGERDGGGDQQW